MLKAAYAVVSVVVIKPLELVRKSNNRTVAKGADRVLGSVKNAFTSLAVAEAIRNGGK